MFVSKKKHELVLARMWNDMLIGRSAAMAYGPIAQQPEEETL